jgi:hypothetical protein
MNQSPVSPHSLILGISRRKQLLYTESMILLGLPSCMRVWKTNGEKTRGSAKKVKAQFSMWRKPLPLPLPLPVVMAVKCQQINGIIKHKGPSLITHHLLFCSFPFTWHSTVRAPTKSWSLIAKHHTS